MAFHVLIKLLALWDLAFSIDLHEPAKIALIEAIRFSTDAVCESNGIVHRLAMRPLVVTFIVLASTRQ
jgi:hypothetical protein